MKKLLLQLALAATACLPAAAQTALVASAAHAQLPTPPAANKAPGAPAGRQPFSTSDGVALYVRVAGQGRPCLFVHGGPGAGSAGVEALAGAMLEEQQQMIYLDQRGSGRSGSPAGAPDFSLARQVQDMEELRQHLHLERWVLLAHSFGGILATEYARQHPGRVEALVLVNSILHLPASMEATIPYAYGLLPAATRPPLPDPAAAPLPQRWGLVMALLGQHKLTGQLMYAHDSTGARVSRAQRGVPANRDFAGSVFQGRHPEYLADFSPATARLPMPVLVVSGRQDYVSGPDHYKSFRFPRQQVLLLPGRHVSLLENQAVLGEALRAFLRRLPRQA